MPQLRIVETAAAAPSVRARELEVGRLVLRAVASPDDVFLHRRAAAATIALEPSTARRALRHAVRALADGDEAALRTSLAAYGSTLERHGVHDAAGEVYESLGQLRPGDATTTLHAARAARRAGRRDAALHLYRRAGLECGRDAHMRLLVRIGEALVSSDPAGALTAIAADARRARDFEALAIAREERARIKTASGRSGAALRDLAGAALRYRDRIDRLRVLHRLAELLSARGDLLGAREVLLAALDQAGPSQRGHSIQRLRTVARALGDELELRRTRGQSAAGPVTIAPAAARRSPSPASAARHLHRWRSLLPAP